MNRPAESRVLLNPAFVRKITPLFKLATLHPRGRARPATSTPASSIAATSDGLISTGTSDAIQ